MKLSDIRKRRQRKYRPGSYVWPAVFLILWTITGCEERPRQEQVCEKFLFRSNTIHDIRIRFGEADYMGQLIRHKLHRDSTQETTFMETTITIDGQTYQSAGVRIKGESSFDFYPGKKKSLKLDLGRFGGKAKHQGHRVINLLNCFKDPTFLREKIYLDLYQDIDLPAPRATYARVYINEEYFGLYLLVEQIDKHFLRRRFRISNGSLFKGVPKGHLTWLGWEPENYFRSYTPKSARKNTNWHQLIDLLAVINRVTIDSSVSLNDSIYSRYLDSVLHTKNCLKAWAINNLLVNIDAYNMYYRHNFYLYYDPVLHKFQWINYDGNYAFGAWTPKFTLAQVRQFDIFYTKQPVEERPLLNILENDVYRQEYLSVMQKLVSKHFVPEKMEARVRKLSDLIREAVYEDTLKMYTNEEFEINIESAIGDTLDPGAFIPGLNEFTRDRCKSVREQLQRYGRSDSRAL